MAANKTLSYLEVYEKMEMGLCLICDKLITEENHYQSAHKNVQCFWFENEEEDEELKQDGLVLSSATSSFVPKIFGVEDTKNSLVGEDVVSDLVSNLHQAIKEEPIVDLVLESIDEQPANDVVAFSSRSYVNFILGDLRYEFMMFASTTMVPTLSRKVFPPPEPPDRRLLTASTVEQLTRPNNMSLSPPPEPPEPPDSIAAPTPSLNQALSRRFSATQYSGTISFRLVPTTFQVYGQLISWIVADLTHIITGERELKLILEGLSFNAHSLGRQQIPTEPMVFDKMPRELLSITIQCIIKGLENVAIDFFKHMNTMNVVPRKHALVSICAVEIYIVATTHVASNQIPIHHWSISYIEVFNDDSSNSFEFFLVGYKCLRSGGKSKDSNQICWVRQKTFPLLCLIQIAPIVVFHEGMVKTKEFVTLYVKFCDNFVTRKEYDLFPELDPLIDLGLVMVWAYYLLNGKWAHVETQNLSMEKEIRRDIRGTRLIRTLQVVKYHSFNKTWEASSASILDRGLFEDNEPKDEYLAFIFDCQKVGQDHVTVAVHLHSIFEESIVFMMMIDHCYFYKLKGTIVGDVLAGSLLSPFGQYQLLDWKLGTIPLDVISYPSRGSILFTKTLLKWRDLPLKHGTFNSVTDIVHFVLVQKPFSPQLDQENDLASLCEWLNVVLLNPKQAKEVHSTKLYGCHTFTVRRSEYRFGVKHPLTNDGIVMERLAQQFNQLYNNFIVFTVALFTIRQRFFLYHVYGASSFIIGSGVDAFHAEDKISYHHLPTRYLLFSQLIKLVALLHRKMVHWGNVRAAKVLVKWKTLPLKHGTWNYSSLRTRMFSWRGYCNGLSALVSDIAVLSLFPCIFTVSLKYSCCPIEVTSLPFCIVCLAHVLM